MQNNIWPGSSVWLERQPVTLEVEGSSPFRVATFRVNPLDNVGKSFVLA